MQRDKQNNNLLIKEGWKVLRFWDFQVQNEFGKSLYQILDYIENFEKYENKKIQ
ncbi:very short patch repair endonuclease [Tangfeifania diversioriginum]|uniref:very short patch repair endonuclease n=1 Tax=Tangfeifania diversioriginum TaxID=1168035 RepID=UPI0021D0527F|nr:very short patch repair endonuclease [Tangfeifania diversioriginum]